MRCRTVLLVSVVAVCGTGCDSGRTAPSGTGGSVATGGRGTGGASATGSGGAATSGGAPGSSATGGAAGSAPGDATGGGGGHSSGLAGAGAGGAAGTGPAGGGGVAGTGGNAGAGGGAGGFGGAAGAGGATLDCDGLLLPDDHPATTTYELGTDTVTDRTTGLMWQRTPATSENLSLARCPTDSIGGHSGWRLPSVLELVTIADYGAYAPAINTSMFATPAPASDEGLFYATATPVARISPLVSWTVAFKTGQTMNGTPISGYVRCVRRAVEKLCFTPPRFAANENASASNGTPTILDKKTTLAWQRDHAPDPLSWEAAKQYCTAFGRAAHLPTVKEALSIVAWDAPTAIDVGTFPDTPAGLFWTSTTVPGASASAFTIRFGDSKATGMQITSKTEAHTVRCVLNP